MEIRTELTLRQAAKTYGKLALLIAPGVKIGFWKQL